MADDGVVDDDESKIVTKFLLDTCRLLRPTECNVVSTAFCAAAAAQHARDDKEVSFIPLSTGSVAEFYIQPMLSCVGDVDIMTHRSDQLAIPHGYPPPSQLPPEFDSRVGVGEIIDSGYPGYVYLVSSYLLTENAGANKYDAVRCRGRQHCISYNNVNGIFGVHGPAITASCVHHTGIGLSFDRVACVRCLSWPTQAANWPTRCRYFCWPDSATVDHVVSNGCDLVGVAHRLCRQHEWMNKHQRRLSFSRAEIVLLNSWMPVQQIVYHMLRVFVKTERLTDVRDSRGTKMFSNYHIKTLMLWACELKPRSWWIVDLNVVRISVLLLHDLADCLRNKSCPHYFVNNCNLNDASLHVEMMASLLASITESWLSAWFTSNYLQKCARLCPKKVTRLFHDVSTGTKLQNAVTAAVNWRLNRALYDQWLMWIFVEFNTTFVTYTCSSTVRSCDYWISEIAKIDSSLSVYFKAVALLHVAHETARRGLIDKLIDVLATVVGHFDGRLRYSNQLSCVLSLNQAAKMMKVVASNSHSTVQLIEIELSKAYLYRALRCKDSDSDSIYCLANLYLAVLYGVTGQHQKAIDHCTVVTRSHNHSQCSSRVVQGELLPKTDDNIDNILGLAVFYQHVRTAALNQQRQTQYVGVFTEELFAHYLHIRCLSVIKCRQFTQMSFTEEVLQYIIDVEQLCAADVLLLKLTMSLEQKSLHKLPIGKCKKSTELDTSQLVELLKQSAVEHLTTYRHFQAQKFGSVATIVTTDFEALYAYKLGDYQQCLQLSTQNVHTLLYASRMPSVLTYAEFTELFDEDIVSLLALTKIVEPGMNEMRARICISQMTLSLYLMAQCQLKLRHSATSMAQTLDCIEVAQSSQSMTLNHLTLKLTERKVMIYLASIMQ